MFKTFSALAGAAIFAAALASFGFTSVSASTPAPVVKADRADTVDCERQGWPYYQTGCIRDPNGNAGRPKPIRLVSADRLEFALPNHTAEPTWAGSIAELQMALPASIRLTK
jgi:hypothetical protein